MSGPAAAPAWPASIPGPERIAVGQEGGVIIEARPRHRPLHFRARARSGIPRGGPRRARRRRRRRAAGDTGRQRESTRSSACPSWSRRSASVSPIGTQAQGGDPGVPAEPDARPDRLRRPDEAALQDEVVRHRRGRLPAAAPEPEPLDLARFVLPARPPEHVVVEVAGRRPHAAELERHRGLELRHRLVDGVGDAEPSARLEVEIGKGAAGPRRAPAERVELDIGPLRNEGRTEPARGPFAGELEAAGAKGGEIDREIGTGRTVQGDRLALAARQREGEVLPLVRDALAPEPHLDHVEGLPEAFEGPVEAYPVHPLDDLGAAHPEPEYEPPPGQEVEAPRGHRGHGGGAGGDLHDAGAEPDPGGDRGEVVTASCPHASADQAKSTPSRSASRT